MAMREEKCSVKNRKKAAFLLPLLAAAILLLSFVSAFGADNTGKFPPDTNGSVLLNTAEAGTDSTAGETHTGLKYVTDMAGILTQAENDELESRAASVSKKYGVGVYIITADNYEMYDQDGVYEAAYGLYHTYSLGEGSDRNGILLFLSMDNRKWAMFCYGNKSEYAFSSYGQEQLEDVFLDDFREDDWYDGFRDYVSACGDYLEQASAGHPVRKSPVPYLLIAAAAALIIAFVVVKGMASAMKNVLRKTEADSFVSGSLHLTKKDDCFIRTDVIRTRIPKSPPPGSGSRSEFGGGGSGRSGSF